MEFLVYSIPVLFVLWLLGVVLRQRKKRRIAEKQRLSSARLAASRLHQSKKTSPIYLPDSRQKLSKSDMADCLAMIDEVAFEHPSGHTKLVARYVMRSDDGDRTEIMFEKNESGRAKLWMTRDRAEALLSAGIKLDVYRASDLYRKTLDGSEPVYGRHSALKSMRELANADLVRFTIQNKDQMRRLLSTLSSKKARAAADDDTLSEITHRSHS